MNSASNSQQNFSSRDISNIKELLKSININDYDPEVLPKLLDLGFQLGWTTVKGCDDYGKYFQLNETTPDSIRLVLKQLSKQSYNELSLREMMIKRAQDVNSQPLPDFTLDTTKNPLHLPPANTCLFAPEFSYLSPKKVRSNEEQSAAKVFPPLGVIPTNPQHHPQQPQHHPQQPQHYPQQQPQHHPRQPQHYPQQPQHHTQQPQHHTQQPQHHPQQPELHPQHYPQHHINHQPQFTQHAHQHQPQQYPQNQSQPQCQRPQDFSVTYTQANAPQGPFGSRSQY